MSGTEDAYIPPHVTTGKTVPPEVARYLDGTDLLAKTQALRLSTVDAAGWPHAALLSAGDMVIVAPGRIRFALFPQSTMTANLVRDGRLTLTLSLDGGMWELRMRARPLAHPPSDTPLACFEAEVDTTRMHRAPYATVTGGITFALNDPQAVFGRWQRQIAALQAAV
jgi:hypothetical protein